MSEAINIPDQIEKQNDNRNHLGKFATDQQAIPQKNLRGFLQQMLEKHGNVPVQYIIDHYQKMIEEYNNEPNSEYAADTTEPIAGYDSQTMDLLDEIFKAGTGNLEVFSLLKFEDVSQLKRIQDYMKEQYPFPWVEWEPIEESHVTLVCSQDVTPGEAGTIGNLIGEVQPVDNVTVDGAVLFYPEEEDGKYVLVLNVVKTPELDALQRKLYEMSSALLLTTSPYSNPDNWHPHITLAYSEEPMDEGILDFVGGFTLYASKIDVTVEREIIGTSLPDMTKRPNQQSEIPQDTRQLLNPQELSAI